MDGWTLAIRHKTNRRKTFVATTKCHGIFQGSRLQVDSKFEPIEGLQRRIVKAKMDLPHKFRRMLFSILDRILRGRQLTVIRVFGIGPFSQSFDSLYQMALLECLIEHFSVAFITSQDPLTSECERLYLGSRGIQVLPPDDLRSDPPLMNSPNDCTLLYMIHCTHDMYNNVLSRYKNAQQQLILIGNDPYNLAATISNQGSVAPYLTNFAEMSIPFPHFEPNENAFQGTAICYVQEDEEEEIEAY